jgi:GrpB-like predicted nucleotidyltransferase (UPF0157 family)
MKKFIEVAEYDNSWPTRFEAEASKLSRVFQHSVVGIHHIGTRAVPGLTAKPTIDLLIELKVGTPVPDYYPDMRQLGYESRGECLDAAIPGTPGRYYFPKFFDSQHVIHVHVCHEGHSQIKELLGLRDYLRTHASEAKAHGIQKARLAVKFTHNNIAYMQGKDSLVKGLIERAMKWKAQQC